MLLFCIASRCNSFAVQCIASHPVPRLAVAFPLIAGLIRRSVFQRYSFASHTVAFLLPLALFQCLTLAVRGIAAPFLRIDRRFNSLAVLYPSGLIRCRAIVAIP